MTLGSIKLEAGCLLVAAPTMLDPHFMHSVVLICAAEAEGVMGVVLNDDSGFSSGDLLGGHPAFEESDFRVGKGGPVGRDQVHFLHNIPERIPGGRAVPEGLYLGGEIEMLGDWMAENQGMEGAEQSVALFVGYSGWGAGQLDQELAEGSWLVLPGEKGLPFEMPGPVPRRGLAPGSGCPRGPRKVSCIHTSGPQLELKQWFSQSP